MFCERVILSIYIENSKLNANSYEYLTEVRGGQCFELLLNGFASLASCPLNMMMDICCCDLAYLDYLSSITLLVPSVVV